MISSTPQIVWRIKRLNAGCPLKCVAHSLWFLLGPNHCPLYLGSAAPPTPRENLGTTKHRPLRADPSVQRGPGPCGRGGHRCAREADSVHEDLGSQSKTPLALAGAPPGTHGPLKRKDPGRKQAVGRGVSVTSSGPLSAELPCLCRVPWQPASMPQARPRRRGGQAPWEGTTRAQNGEEGLLQGRRGGLAAAALSPRLRATSSGERGAHGALWPLHCSGGEQSVKVRLW